MSLLPCDPTVSILERMDLRESVMQPRCFYFWAHSPKYVFIVHPYQSIHFVLHKLGRAVLVNFSVRA